MAENCCGGNTTAPDIWKRTLVTVDTADPHGTPASNRWNFSAWTPDAVVINLGTNDNLHSRPELTPTFNSTYLQLVLDAGKAYGEQTAFFLACGPMDDTYCDPVQWVITQAKKHGLKAFFLDQRGFDTDCCGHPCASADKSIAAATAKSIASKMGWDAVESVEGAELR